MGYLIGLKNVGKILICILQSDFFFAKPKSRSFLHLWPIELPILLIFHVILSILIHLHHDPSVLHNPLYFYVDVVSAKDTLTP